MDIKKILIIILWIQICNSLEEGDDLHSSVTALNYVFNVEKFLIENLSNYIRILEQNINFFKKSLKNVLENHQNSTEYKYDQSGRSVLNLFNLRRNLLQQILIFQTDINYTKTETIKHFLKITTENDLPDENDLDGVTLGILRIQQIYEVSAEDIVKGVIDDIQFTASTKFTASDCLQLGLKLRAMNFNYYAIQWLEIAIKRIEEEGWKGITPAEEKNFIIDLLINTKYNEGSLENVKDSVDISLKILKEHYENNTVALQFVKNLKIFLMKYVDLKLNNIQVKSFEPPNGTIVIRNLTEFNLLKKGCQGKLQKSSKEQQKLFCKYQKDNHPFLLLSPIKVEILNLEPYLFLAYDVLYDSEIEILKKLSEGKLTRAAVWDLKKGVGITSTYRTSKLVWFNNKTHPLIHTLNQRVSDITGLTMETAEDFQLTNYGIGGHYDLHHDYFIEPEDFKGAQRYPLYELGNRLATLLFYMSDVEHGGGTTWPVINILTSAKKGSAAFWYNLFLDGKPNRLARHSACPVILGSKWAINKWIRMRGQEFRKPCLTYPDHSRKL